jgi:site-specific DNA recombinase
MQNKKYFSYVRVSTQRQGQLGTSLIEQKAAIERYAQKFNLITVKHFEERETAAKSGRPVFLEMLKSLRRGEADGVITHKIDRTARNLKDWADFQSLIDSGIEIHFAAESLDLNSRGGRLSADIQAVVASDFIRNLREETKKGIYGRLKQGLYPFPAVTGYVNAGKGNPKKIDKIQGSLVKQTFELYSKGNIGLNKLGDIMYENGLRSNKNGKKITVNGLSSILHNPFYTGMIRIVKTGEMFVGQHKPLVSRTLFNQVQAIFEGKKIRKSNKHFFVFRRQIICAKCKKVYIAEKQKGEIYYRCHTKDCSKGTVREDKIENEVLGILKGLKLNDMEYRYFKQATHKQNAQKEFALQQNQRQLRLLQDNLAERFSKLADAYMDDVFDKETYIKKKNQLLIEEQSLKEKLANQNTDCDKSAKKLDLFLELVNSAYLSYQSGTPEQKQELVKTVFSNCEIENKNVLFKPYLPFQLIAERPTFTSGSPSRDTTRTLSPLFQKLFMYFQKVDTSKNDN